MKLRNKKTGEIVDVYKGQILLHCNQGKKTIQFKSIEELEEWEDYEEPKDFYYIQPDGDIHRVQCKVPNYQLIKFRKIGNYFDTREEAKKAMEKLKAWKLLRDECDIKFDGIIRDDKAMLKGVKLSYDRHTVTFARMQECINALHLLFGGED